MHIFIYMIFQKKLHSILGKLKFNLDKTRQKNDAESGDYLSLFETNKLLFKQ